MLDLGLGESRALSVGPRPPARHVRVETHECGSRLSLVGLVPRLDERCPIEERERSDDDEEHHFVDRAGDWCQPERGKPAKWPGDARVGRGDTYCTKGAFEESEHAASSLRASRVDVARRALRAAARRARGSSVARSSSSTSGRFSSTRRIALPVGHVERDDASDTAPAPAATLVAVWLAGVSLSDDLVVELAQRLQRNGAERTAQALLKAAISGRSTAALGREDRTNILAVLADPPLPGLEELHGVLLREVRRGRGGL